MRIPRIYHPFPLNSSKQLTLTIDAAHHLVRVLKMAKGDCIELFDGSHQSFYAEIIHVDKNQVDVLLDGGRIDDRSSPLHLHLGQVISRGDKMEFTIQKSTELGVNVITPLFSERCGVKLDANRLAKKIQQWQKIAISACEQSGQNQVPKIRQVCQLEDWCAQQSPDFKLNLHPKARNSIHSLPPQLERIRLLIGPEGGLSIDEINMTAHYGFTNLLLGPRVLRTETAALAAITALQIRFGDLG